MHDGEEDDDGDDRNDDDDDALKSDEVTACRASYCASHAHRGVCVPSRALRASKAKAPPWTRQATTCPRTTDAEGTRGKSSSSSTLNPRSGADADAMASSPCTLTQHPISRRVPHLILGMRWWYMVPPVLVNKQQPNPVGAYCDVRRAHPRGSNPMAAMIQGPGAPSISDHRHRLEVMRAHRGPFHPSARPAWGAP